MVFMLAIVFAFATENNTSVMEDAPITGFIYQNGFCVPAPKDCDQISFMPCTYNGNQVYAEKFSDTYCRLKLTHSGL
ncbi:MAG: hypothetical protein CMP04_05925 [Xanthomarina sp.]|uniref:Uncharacterized protein n=2 Tax=Flavobacteriaceae TaxID=49546 RepID=A0A3D6BPK6_9FLAO|nr:hypothetical protein [Xanthomarina sp.]HCY80938.1 hypothetical protein [Xanthomarina gelatinilytica]